jgi:hypothetical protein
LPVPYPALLLPLDQSRAQKIRGADFIRASIDAKEVLCFLMPVRRSSFSIVSSLPFFSACTSNHRRPDPIARLLSARRLPLEQLRRKKRGADFVRAPIDAKEVLLFFL